MNLPDCVEQFITPSGVDERSLYEFISQHFQKDLEWLEYMFSNQHHNEHWLKLKNFINSAELQDKARLERGISEIERIQPTLEGWISDHTSSHDRFILSVQSKAAELPGKLEDNYDMALLIRHDQLLAAVYVFQQVIDHLATIFQQTDMTTISESESYAYFLEKTLEPRIFEAAEEIYKLREKYSE